MYAQYDIDIFAILILIVVLVNNIKSGGIGQMRQKLFRSIIVCDILLLALDMAILVIIGKPGGVIHIALGILQCYFFAICSLLCLLWAFFCSAKRGRQNRARLLLMSLPFLILIVSLLINFGNGSIFEITDGNLYQRGPLFHIVTVCTYPYIIYSVFVIIRNKKNFQKNELYPYLLTPILPMAAGIIQLAFEIDVLIVWPSVAIGLMVMQLYSLNEKINVDHMTGLYNRKYLDGYVEDILQMGRLNYSSKSKKKFAALMLDIDNFKKINDTLGHVEGDNAIKTAAEILNRSVRKGDFVSRYGGDEFLIILNQCSMNTPRRVIGRIKDNTQRYNEEHELPYKLEFSVGYKVFSNMTGLTAKEIFSSIDELMYKNKHSKAFVVDERQEEPSLNV
jgi:diguanylate cyclase (GGDEF)-like protein